MRYRLFAASFIGAVFLSGCSTYITPSGRAEFTNFTSASMAESFAAEPAAGFPAGIAAVRVQSPNYRNYHTLREGGVHGQGRYSVVTVKEIEEDADIDRIASLPDIGGLASISRLLLPDHFRSDRELREAAARLKADMVLLYTFDTTFHKNDKSVALNVITLGLSPTRTIHVRVSASALLIDTRTGFIYAAIEANDRRDLISSTWESRESADRARRDAEAAAFKKLVDNFVQDWPRIVARASQGA